MQTIQEIVELIKSNNIAEDIRFHFQKVNDYTLSDNFNFWPVNAEEDAVYNSLDGELKQSFKSNTAYICLPDTTLDTFVRVLKERLSHIYLCHKILVFHSLHKTAVAKVLNEKIDILIVINMILHEIGHWEDFKKDNCILQIMQKKRDKYYAYTNDNELKLRAIMAFLSSEESQMALFGNLYHNYMGDIEKFANDYASTTLEQIFPIIESKISPINSH